MSKDKIKIPKEANSFIRDFIKLARHHKIRKLSGKFKFYNFPDDIWPEDIQFDWEQGRHGAKTKINLWSKFTEFINEVRENKEQSHE
jgi:hypothetical protein